MKNMSMKVKIPLFTGLLVVIGFLVMTLISINNAKTKVTEAMVSQFTNEANQVADQAEMILANGGGTKELQTFVEREISDNSYIAYAVVIDKNVTAIAHSDKDKVGKSYADDTEYTVEAAKNGKVMTSSFYADVQKAWTYDVMVPIYKGSTLYGSMDIGVYDSQVDNVVSNLRIRMIIVAVITILVICVLVALMTASAFKPLDKLKEICGLMGNGDFSHPIDAAMTKNKNEVGEMSAAMEKMRVNLASLIAITADQAKEILTISDNLHETAMSTQDKANDIYEKSGNAVEETGHQSALTQANTEMTEEINRGMDEISNNIINVTEASAATSQEATDGEKKLDVVVQQMDEIASKVNATYEQIQELDKMSVQIQSVINLIADIATQTNLLALNASIEAARAGEHGKGFAVVANEVSSLADQSKQAADEIGKIISGIQNSITDAVTLMEEGRKSVESGIEITTEAKMGFQGITDKITQVSDEMTNVSAITQEVNASTANLVEAITSISSISESVAEKTLNISDASDVQKQMMGEVIDQVDTLENLSKELQAAIEQFKIEA